VSSVRCLASSGKPLSAMRRLIVPLVTILASVPAANVGAAELGTITGRVVNQSTGQPQPGVIVVLTSAIKDGSGRLSRRAVTDARGRYGFDELPTGQDRFYALDARFQGGTFAGRAISIPSDTTQTPVIETTLRVWDTTTDPGAIVLQRDDLFVISTAEGAAVIESVTIANVSDSAYIGRGEEMSENESSGASVGFALPDGASNVRIEESDIDIPALVELDAGVAATVAFPPGETRVTFSYEVPGSGASIDLSRPALYPTLELSIFAKPPLEIRSNRLRKEDSVTLEGTSYERWSATGALDAGDPLQALAIAEAGLSVLPLIAILAAAILIGAGGTFVLRRRRGTPARDERHDLLVAVAELDLAFESGDLPEGRYRTERARLRSKLERAGGSR
jgi:5-hydroxyisourate hydrolase-like protein (transthyretin family)